MKIEYKNRRLEKQLTDPQTLIKSFGQMAKRLNQRLRELGAAECLEDMRTLPAARCHELKGNKEGQLAVNISGNYRLIFQPHHDPIPLKDDGGLDWANVNTIKLLEIIDYH